MNIQQLINCYKLEIKNNDCEIGLMQQNIKCFNIMINDLEKLQDAKLKEVLDTKEAV